MKQKPRNTALGLQADQTYLFASDTSKVGGRLHVSKIEKKWYVRMCVRGC